MACGDWSVEIFIRCYSVALNCLEFFAQEFFSLRIHASRWYHVYDVDHLEDRSLLESLNFPIHDFVSEGIS